MSNIKFLLLMILVHGVFNCRVKEQDKNSDSTSKTTSKTIKDITSTTANSDTKTTFIATTEAITEAKATDETTDESTTESTDESTTEAKTRTTTEAATEATTTTASTTSTTTKVYELPEQKSDSGIPAIKPFWGIFSDPFASNAKQFIKKSRKIQARIVAGEEARPHSWPWQVSLQVHKPVDANTISFNHFCSGSLIYDDLVLTAAHCCAASIDNGYFNDTRVVVGIHDYTALSIDLIYKVSKMIIHENYDSKRIRSDVCLIKLTTKVVFGTNVNTIRIPSVRDYILGKRVAITGWY
jgi:hypothetical protein